MQIKIFCVWALRPSGIDDVNRYQMEMINANTM